MTNFRSMSLFSQDSPRSTILVIALCILGLTLALAPAVLPGAKALNVAVKIILFIVLAASFDLLLGYAGIVSFAHTMFYGIGAYGVAIACSRLGPHWSSIAIGVGGASVLSLILAIFVGAFSLRVRAIFFAMITLAVGSAFLTLASQASAVTGGEDGITFRVPPALYASAEYFRIAGLNFVFDGKALSYYILLVTGCVLFLLLLRIVNSPFGKVLLAIRENEFRASAIGYRVVRYRIAANAISALFACIAGAMTAFWLRFNGPETTLSMEVMLDVLLMVVIGGMGSIWGAVVGATILVLAQGYLQDVLQLVHESAQTVPAVAAIFAPERWLIWLGIMFVLSVYYFPEGVVGRLRAIAARGRTNVRMKSDKSA